MTRIDRYGRGSAAANGEGFVDLAPGDTFAALEEQLGRRISERFDNLALGISASIGSKRNASELAKHLASGEEEEVHKFAAKNIGILFAQGRLAISHDDKKAVDETREKPKILRVFSAFEFAGNPLVATITLKPTDSGLRLYAIEALDIMRDECPEVHLAAEPRHFKTTRPLLRGRIAYYVGDVNRTHPKFVSHAESFTIERTVELLEGILKDFRTSRQAPGIKPKVPTFSIIIPVYNVAPYLRECLDSVCVAVEKVERLKGFKVEKLRGGVEVICVDDGSTDGSAEILDEYAVRFNSSTLKPFNHETLKPFNHETLKPFNFETFQPFNFSTFKVAHQPNQGVAIARQVALEMCTGEWIAAVDPDDWVEPDYFARLLEATVAEDVDMVWCGFTEEREDGAHVVRQEIAPDFKTQVLALLDGSLWGGMWMRLVRRDFIVRHQLGFPKIRIVNCEDTLFVASVLAAGARVKYADVTGYHYRIRADSSVRQKGSLQTFLSLMEIADRLEMVLREKWAAEPLGIWRKECLKSPYLDESIPDDVFFAHTGGCKDLWGSRAPFHHKLMYWLATRGWRSSLVKLIALTRRWRGLK